MHLTEQKTKMLKSRHFGPATETSRRDPHTEGPGGFASEAFNDEHYGCSGLLSVHSFGLPNFSRPFPECAVDPGASPGMETDEEVALNPDDSEPGPVRRMSLNWAGSLRRELSQRAEQYARTHGLPHCLSYGQTPTVCFEHYDDGSRHGNFLPATYKAILRTPNWRRRLLKVHSQRHKSLPGYENGIRRELDSCTSSDALLMNVFCYPGVLRDGRVGSILDVKPLAIPDFGFRARVPLANGKFDRTEVDMRLGDLLIEAKLTESDFQRASKAAVHGYRDLAEVFDCADLPQTEREYRSYQLIRNVMAAHASGCAFCVFTDARRPELIEAWYAVMRCVRPVVLRTRCKVLTWQELGKALPKALREFLDEKYGIGPPSVADHAKDW